MSGARFQTLTATTFLFAVAVGLLLSSGVSAQDDPQMAQYQALSTQFVQLRDVGSQTLGPADLAAACDALIQQINQLISATAGDPSVMSKSQELLSYVCSFAGMDPDSISAYSAYLGTLEAWQGQDYAVMVVRRAEERGLRLQQYTDVCRYFGIFAAKYPGRGELVQGHYYAGLACTELGAYDDAAGHFQAVIAAGDGNPWAALAYRKLANVQFLNQPAGAGSATALATLQQVIDKYPKTMHAAYARYERGQMLALGGSYLEALAEYALVVSDYPESQAVLDAQVEIQKLQNLLESGQLETLGD
jgi:tetratricopeptide (TPR) repeat protein